MNRFINRRRVFGSLFLAIAVLLLILGETFFKHRLGPVATLGYWTACLFATLGAILCSLVDVSLSLRQSRTDRHQLLAETLRNVEAEHERHKGVSRQPRESR